MFKKNIVLLVSVIALTAVFSFVTPSQNKACAAQWGPNCGSPGYQTCPNNQPWPYSSDYCVYSVNLVVLVAIDGIMNPNSTVTISPAMQDLTCSYVKCLKRADTKTVTWGSIADMSPPYVLFETLGCSDGSCNDDTTISASTNDPNCQAVTPAPIAHLSGANASDQTVTVNFKCTAPVVSPTPLECNDTCTIGGTPCKTGYACDTTSSRCRLPSNPTSTTCSSPVPATQKCNEACSASALCVAGLECTSAGICRLPGYPDLSTCKPPPGVTIPPPPTATPNLICPVPGTPVVTVTCTGCGGGTPGTNPTPTLIQSGPTPTIGASTPTPTPSGNTAPTPTPITKKPNGESCRADLECESNICNITGNSGTGLCSFARL